MDNHNQPTFSFNWGSQQSHILDGLKTLAVGELNNVFLTDVTLACEGDYIEAHRLVLSLCSSFFKDLFNRNERISEKANGIVILGNVTAKDLRYILQFMYQGEVQIPREDVESFLQAGEMLKVEGLVGSSRVGVGVPVPDNKVTRNTASSASVSSSQSIPKLSQAHKRPRSAASFGREEQVVGDSKKLNLGQNNVKQEQCQELNQFEDDNDSGGGLMEDYGDAGGDSDFGDNEPSNDRIENEVKVSPAPGPSKPKKENKKTTNPNQIYSSSSDSDDDNDSSDSDSGSTEDYFDSPATKLPYSKPYRRFNWDLARSFDTIEEAKAHVRSEKCWKSRSIRTTVEGKKYNYDCSVSRECPVKIYVLDVHSNPPIVHLFTTSQEHQHEGVKQKQGLSSQVKEQINQLWKKGVKRPKRILWELKKQGVEPSIRQVASYVQYNLRSKVKGTNE
ncbi:unnamed protein product [Orchesella dallaii]|uniref:BTB domain-containing protein n=1 Tax=Orchesella dallaii TaxID=48710 RepID=A0ABP1QTI9_9HEXA